MRKRRKNRFLRVFLFAVTGFLLGGVWYVRREVSPMPAGDKRYIRIEEGTGLGPALLQLEKDRIIRNARATRLYANVRGVPAVIRSGTYELAPGMTAEQVFAALKKPIRNMVRIPETNFSYRTARLLEKREVCSAEDYLKFVHSPQNLKKQPSFPVPKTGLEGYLYPDTYDLPPLIGAEGVVQRQLAAFEKKILDGFPKDKDLHRTLTIASMVELEVQKDNERALVAGVIENRLRIGMRLQIDATINYALKEWRPLTFADLRMESPYNTYRVSGLPPGPICSPTDKSVQAALNPAKHNYLYYVAMPDGTHLFSATFDEHRANIGKRKRALAAQG